MRKFLIQATALVVDVEDLEEAKRLVVDRLLSDSQIEFAVVDNWEWDSA